MTRCSGPWMSHPTAPTQVFLMLRKYSGNPANGTAMPAGGHLDDGLQRSQCLGANIRAWYLEHVVRR